ncbi:MAG TPA: YhcH/YjgK/YiaL family protein [Candidatus Acidoferrales bacterium]|nr:YhcH/YjgK/YiaL family protein [Candidatus Acidoferrales bacterium]
MISDSLENLNKYQQIIPHSKEICDYLNTTNIFSLAVGKYPIAGDSAFILIQEYLTKADAEKKWESHRKYIDIQIVLDGQEIMGYSPAPSLKSKDGYNEEKDITFYEDDSWEHSRLFVPKNYFCLFFPEDAHKPGLRVLKDESVKKAVIKASIY